MDKARWPKKPNASNKWLLYQSRLRGVCFIYTPDGIELWLEGVKEPALKQIYCQDDIEAYLAPLGYGLLIDDAHYKANVDRVFAHYASVANEVETECDTEPTNDYIYEGRRMFVTQWDDDSWGLGIESRDMGRSVYRCALRYSTQAEAQQALEEYAKRNCLPRYVRREPCTSGKPASSVNTVLRTE